MKTPSEPSRDLTLLTHEVSPVWLGAFESFALRTFSALGFQEWEVSITFCTDAFIQNLNRQWRGKDEPTDILSFEMDCEACWTRQKTDKTLCGDLVISLQTLKSNCAYFAVNEEEELKRLTVHGLLHLCGWNHATNETTEPMLQRQEKVLETLKEVKIF